jgi:hypothetical protein
MFKGAKTFKSGKGKADFLRERIPAKSFLCISEHIRYNG